jgi:outer membrane protein TolC
MKNAKQKVAIGILVFTMFLGAIQSHAQDSQKLSLMRAVSLALQNSRELALERAKVDTAKNIARVDRAEFRPDLYTGSGAAYTNGLPIAVNGQPPSLFQLTYSQTIYDAPLRGRIRAEEERVKTQEIEMTRMRDAVIVRTATSYLELAKVHHSLDLLRNERASARQILEFTRKRAANGMELPIEVTKSELAVARIDQRLAQMHSRTQILTAQLENLTGIPSAQFDEVSAEELPQVNQPAEDVVRLALENSPMLKAAESEQSARQMILKGERGGYGPAVALIGQYNVLSRANGYDQFFKAFQRNNVSLGVLIRIPIFNSKTSANTALAGSQLSEAKLNVGILRNNEQVAAEQAVNNLAEQDAALAVVKLELKLAQENLALIQKRFDLGQSSLKELEQARLDEGEKWVAFLDADFARQQAQLALMEKTGQLSQVFK